MCQNSRASEKLNLKVLYRDENFIFVDKPSGMVVHRGWAKDKITVSDILRDQIIGSQVFALHRLDRGTSGVMGFALQAEYAKLIQEQLIKGTVHKEYLALVRGPFDEPILLDHAIPREKGGRRVKAITEFCPVLRAGRWSFLKAIPKTGRPHQIRRHLKHLSLPIIGDVKYGKGEINRFFKEEYGLNRLALHATKIEFEHPESKNRVAIESKVKGRLLDVLIKVFPEFE